VTRQPYHTRLELPDGHGVVLDPSCALCGEPMELSILCPVCHRAFCAHGCFGVHLIASDEADENADAVLAKLWETAPPDVKRVVRRRK
jgi:hypothetical protein